MKFVVVLFFPLVLDLGDAGLAPDGLHVCITRKTRLKSYREPYKTTRITAEPCGQIKRKRCLIYRTVYQTLYRTLYRQENTLLYQCCSGWLQSGVHCSIPLCSQPCFHGNCTEPDVCSCEPGYQGVHCNTTCDLNHYGPGCNKSCLCQNGGKCDRRNGTCACTLGWHGKNCELPCAQADQTPICKAAQADASIVTTQASKTTRIQSTEPIDFCETESTGEVKLKGIFYWRKTPVGSIATLQCPYGPQGAHASRACVSRKRRPASWQRTQTRTCNFKRDHNRKLVALLRGGVNASNARNVCRLVKAWINESEGRLSDVDISDAADMLQNIVEVREVLDQNGQDIVDIVDKIMDLNETQLEESQRNTNASTKFLKAIEFLIENLPLPENQTTRKIFSQNIVIQTTKVIISSFAGLSFPSGSGDKTKAEANIDLPETLFQNHDSQIQQETRIGFTYFHNSKLFRPVGERRHEYFVNSRVISASVRGAKLEGLKSSVNITLTPLRQNSTVTSDLSCVYWDFSMGGGRGNWSTRGCSLRNSEPDDIFCVCDHLTSFAVLIVPRGKRPAGEDTQKTHHRILSVISYVGCAISLAGASLTLLTYLMFKPLRKSPVQIILMSLCWSLMLLLIMFLTGVERHSIPELCLCVAVSLHYFLLTTITWMAIEAHSMYLSLVRTLPTSAYPSRYVLRCSIVAWGIPAVIVGITVGTETSCYGTGNSCVLGGIPFFVAQFIPVCTLLLFNFIIFIVVLHNLGRSSLASPNQRTTGYQRLRIAAILTVLLGLTWSFGVMTVAMGSVTWAFEYLFCVFNSLQGFFIFYFNCLRRPEVCQHWTWFLKGKGLKGWPEISSRMKAQAIPLTRMQRQTTTAATTSNLTKEDEFEERLHLKETDNN